MNTTILSKCVEELKKEQPNISYVLGMLETVIAMSNYPSAVIPTSSVVPPPPNYVPTIQETTEEDELLAKYTGGPIGAINTY